MYKRHKENSTHSAQRLQRAALLSHKQLANSLRQKVTAPSGISVDVCFELAAEMFAIFNQQGNSLLSSEMPLILSDCSKDVSAAYMIEHARVLDVLPQKSWVSTRNHRTVKCHCDVVGLR